MITQIAQLKVAEGRGAEFEKASIGAFGLVRRGDGCGGVTMLRSVEQPESYYVLIHWDSIEHHRRFENVNAVNVRANIEGLATQILSQHFEVVDLALRT